VDGGFSFPANAMRARDEINDALGMSQRVPNLGMAPNQQQMQLPGNPQISPQGVSLSGQQQIGPGTLGGGATVGPQGFGGAGANYNMPVAGGQFNVGAGVDPNMRFSGAQAGYQRGPISVDVGYQPGAGVSGGLQFRKAFKRGGAVKNDDFAVKRDEYAAGGGAWTRKEGKNPEGGLNAKGRASLKAQGQDIKPPVSAKQAAKSPKAAARRKSFCARMGGMEGPMKDESGKPTRKALALRKWDCKAQGGMVEGYAEGGKSRVNEAGNYTKPTMRKGLFNSIKAGGKGGAPGQWSARKAQMLAQQYKAKGGGYRD
jgi:hypothetical protein